MKKATLAVLATVLFGKFIPYVLLLMLLIGLIVIVQAAIKEGKQL